MKYQFSFSMIIVVMVLSACLPSSSSNQIITPTMVLPTPTPSTTPSPTIAPTPTLAPPMQLVIVNDPNPVENIPYLSWDEITSQEFVQSLIIMDKNGQLIDFSSEAVPLTPKDTIFYKPDNPNKSKFLLKYGGEPIFGLAWPGPYLANIKRIPWVTVGIWETDIQGNRIYVIVDKWKNYDGSTGFIGYLSFSWNYDSITNILLGYTSKNVNNRRMTVGSYLDGEAGCKKYLANLKKYTNYNDSFQSIFCYWYLNNTATTLAPEIFRTWQKTGILNNETINEETKKIYRLPITLVSTIPFGQ